MTRQLREHVWWLNLTGVNAYIIQDGETLTLVDAGSPLDAKKIRKGVAAVADSVRDIDRVLITHFDIDHIGSLHRLDELDATIHIGRADLPHLTGEKKPSLRVQKEAFQRALDWMRKPPDLPVEPLDDGEEIGSFTAHSAPGHTPGHTVLVSEELSVACLGDLLREKEGRYVVPPRIICHDHDQAKADIIELAHRLPAFEAGCQGHGLPFKAHGSEHLADCAARVREAGTEVTTSRS